MLIVEPMPPLGMSARRVLVAVSAIAAEQYIAISTARGFIGTGDNGCFVFFEAHERLDFFKILPLPSHGSMFILCRRRASILCKRFLKPVAALILPPSNSECKWAKRLKPWTFAGRRGTLPLTSAAPTEQHS